MHLSQVVYIKYKNLESVHGDYSISVLVEFKIFKHKSKDLLYAVNMTGWRTECISLHDTHLMTAYFLYNANWKEFSLNMRIIDMLYQTQESTEMKVIRGTMIPSENIDVRLINVIFEPFRSKMFQKIRSDKFNDAIKWIPLLKSQTIVYPCLLGDKSMKLTEYVFSGTIFKYNFMGLSKITKENQLLIPIRGNDSDIVKCKQRAKGFKIYNN
ncbi:hypothetical protein RF11_03258 [Thelohanellus kitauei]|uniref:Uncharacterized protein n=1 Tax=Thelohanellus kitauei TaxID=669202 RepID=A0A0C2N458_THEKT|nr:hypothetical protein RF11_03258 [Thelohanellus kitauei]